MGKHETSYPRVERDHYPTPSWAVDALAEHVDLVCKVVWECAAGAGQMAEALKAAGAAKVCSTDVVERSSPRDAVFDFLFLRDPGPRCDLIATNPPLGPGGKLAAAFVARGLEQPRTGKAWPCCCRPISTAARPSPNSSRLPRLRRQDRAHAARRVVQARRWNRGAEGKHRPIPVVSDALRVHPILYAPRVKGTAII